MELKHTASTFFQYLINNEVAGNKKVAGFIIIGKSVVLQFSKTPSITEWMEISNIWYRNFEHKNEILHIKLL